MSKSYAGSPYSKFPRRLNDSSIILYITILYSDGVLRYIVEVDEPTKSIWEHLG